MLTMLTQDNQTTITLSKEVKERLEAFRKSLEPKYNDLTWDELLESMLDLVEEARKKKELLKEVIAPPRPKVKLD